jgi:excinuclease ABC subunit A
MVEARDIKACEKKNKKHSIEAIIDRIVMKEGVRSRLNDSVETALRLGEGLCLCTYLKDDGEWEDVLYSEVYACPDCNISFEELSPRMFSFNSPYGACEVCGGLGNRLELDPELIIPDDNVSINDGAIAAWRKGGKRMAIYYNKMLRMFSRDYGVSLDEKWKNLSDEVKDIIIYGDDDPGFEGVIPNLEHRFNNTDSEYVKQRIHGFMSVQPCPTCKGMRLKPESLGVKVNDLSIMDVCDLTITKAIEFFNSLKLGKEKREIAKPVVKEIEKRLSFLSGVGLEYLSMNRTAGTLSGGEFQRIRLASQVGNGLVGVCYVLDEPTIGLHQRDNHRLLETLLNMRDIGNTVIVVEHDEDVIRAADYLVDLGPGAGSHGGEIIAEGTVKEVTDSPKSITGGYLAGENSIEVPQTRRKAYVRSGIRVKGAKENNLRNINVSFPLGVITCVTGVSGSGKSTLVNEIMYKALARELNRAKTKPGKHKEILGTGNVDKIINIDQAPIGKTPRSNPATYTGVFDLIRNLFSKLPEAKLRGYQAGRFSFNVKGGRCEACQGQGFKKIEMHFLPDVYVECEECKGKRYNRETLEVKYKGLSIADVLDLQIGEAIRIFKNHPQIYNALMTLADVGLSYVSLGQSSTTLSGGEAERVKLATELSKRSTGKTVYVLDEPTTGLHFDDIRKLLKVINRLADKGNTVIIIEHNLDVIKSADYIIDLGPEGGENGGKVIANGTPEEVAEVKKSFTGQFLKTMFGKNKKKEK